MGTGYFQNKFGDKSSTRVIFFIVVGVALIITLMAAIANLFYDKELGQIVTLLTILFGFAGTIKLVDKKIENNTKIKEDDKLD